MSKDKKINQKVSGLRTSNRATIKVTISEPDVVKQQRKNFLEILTQLSNESYSIEQMLHFVEGVIVEYTMKVAKGNKTIAAKQLGISKKELRNMLEVPFTISTTGVNDEIF